jgi:hypothetical protein
MQPQGEPETNVQQLEESWKKIMAPAPEAAAAAVDETKPEVSDIPSSQN